MIPVLLNRLFGVLGAFLLVGAAAGMDFSDTFAIRPTSTAANAVFAGSNVTATLEPREPLHAGKPGGHSVWLSWVAPTNGLVTLSTEGSTFDTLVGVYTTERGDDPPLARLHEAVESDDNGQDTFTVLQFGARAGVRYEIAIDGFAGATGDIVLSLDLLPTDSLLPAIMRRSPDQALRMGDTLILGVDIQPTESLEVHWLLNNNQIPESSSPILVVRNFQATNVGLYRLKLTIDDVKLYSAPIEVQINSEGFVTALARNKLKDAVASALVPSGGGGFRPASVGGGVNRGYNGTQVFNTSLATRDPLEPEHCGTPGGATYWFSYQPPADGVLALNTDGSSYDTLLAVYTYDPPLVDYASLIPVACNDNSSSNTLTSRLQFIAGKTRTYLVVVDGVNGARGLAYLNYSLTASNPPPRAPVIVRDPESITVGAGNVISLDVLVGGAEPMTYQWQRNGSVIAGRTNASLAIDPAKAQNAGAYSVTVSNADGFVTSTVAQVNVLNRPSIETTSGGMDTVIGFPVTRGYQYRVEVTDCSTESGWTLLSLALADYGGMIWMTNSVQSPEPCRFYRAIKP